jgi:hypothetical protein
MTEPNLLTDNLLTERGKTHGDWEQQAATAYAIKEALCLHARVLPAPIAEALDHIAIKLARIVRGNPLEPDHWRDIQGYARLAELWIEEQTTINAGGGRILGSLDRDQGSRGTGRVVEHSRG